MGDWSMLQIQLIICILLNIFKSIFSMRVFNFPIKKYYHHKGIHYVFGNEIYAHRKTSPLKTICVIISFIVRNSINQ